MSDPFGDRPFPRGPLLGAGTLIAAALLAVGAVRMTDVGHFKVPASTTTAERSLFFNDLADGGIAVIDARDNRTVAVLPAGEDNFVRATLRTFARERRSRGIGAEAPFRLIARGDGGLTLEDPAVGRRVELTAFGPTNSAAFARLMTAQATR